MDSISDSNIILWLFLGILLFYFFTIIFNFGVWVESKKISIVSYYASAIAFIVVCFFNIEIFFFSASYEPDFINFIVYGKIFTIVGIILFFGSILFQKKNRKILRNILINLCVLGGLVLLTCAWQMKY